MLHMARTAAERWKAMDKTIKEQILKVRDTALCNMFDFGMVKAIAAELECPELAVFIDTNTDDYVHFILTGEE